MTPLEHILIAALGFCVVSTSLYIWKMETRDMKKSVSDYLRDAASQIERTGETPLGVNIIIKTGSGNVYVDGDKVRDTGTERANMARGYYPEHMYRQGLAEMPRNVVTPPDGPAVIAMKENVQLGRIVSDLRDQNGKLAAQVADLDRKRSEWKQAAIKAEAQLAESVVVEWKRIADARFAEIGRLKDAIRAFKETNKEILATANRRADIIDARDATIETLKDLLKTEASDGEHKTHRIKGLERALQDALDRPACDCILGVARRSSDPV